MIVLSSPESRAPTSSHDGRRRNRSRFRRAETFIQEALEPPCVKILANIDIASAVDGNRVRDVERASPQALLAEPRDDAHRLALENPDVVVGAVDHVEKAL